VATERAIVVAASLANHIAVREQLPVGLVTEAHDPRHKERASGRARFVLPPRGGQGQLMRLLETLACAQVISESEPGAEPAQAGFAGMLREAARDLSWGTTLSIITGKESPELLDTLFYLRRAGFAVALILVQAGRGSGGRLGVPVYRVWEEGDLGSVLGRLPGTRSLNPGRVEGRLSEVGP
jgi:hypothetical protein